MNIQKSLQATAIICILLLVASLFIVSYQTRRDTAKEKLEQCKKEEQEHLISTYKSFVAHQCELDATSGSVYPVFDSVHLMFYDSLFAPRELKFAKVVLIDYIHHTTWKSWATENEIALASKLDTIINFCNTDSVYILYRARRYEIEENTKRELSSMQSALTNITEEHPIFDINYHDALLNSLINKFNHLLELKVENEQAVFCNTPNSQRVIDSIEKASCSFINYYNKTHYGNTTIHIR